LINIYLNQNDVNTDIFWCDFICRRTQMEGKFTWKRLWKWSHLKFGPWTILINVVSMFKNQLISP